MNAVVRSRYVDDLKDLVGPRTTGSPKWQQAQDLCASRFADLGYDVELQPFERGVNVLARQTGGKNDGPPLVIGAHYDSVADCDGADDNASGVAGLLELARVLSREDFDRPLVLACWDQEEVGLLGSVFHAQHLAKANEQILVTLVFEMIGYARDEPNSQTLPANLDAMYPEQVEVVVQNKNRGNFLAAIGNSSAASALVALQQWSPLVDLPLVAFDLPDAIATSMLAADLRRSDHAAFWDHDYPAVMLTDTANFRNHHYHCFDGDDTIETLDHDFATNVIKITAGAAIDLLCEQ